MKYFIDYGHGGDDPGAIGGNVLEKNINKLVGERVKFHLERHGQTVVLTRVRLKLQRTNTLHIPRNTNARHSFNILK